MLVRYLPMRYEKLPNAPTPADNDFAWLYCDDGNPVRDCSVSTLRFHSDSSARIMRSWVMTFRAMSRLRLQAVRPRRAEPRLRLIIECTVSHCQRCV